MCDTQANQTGEQGGLGELKNADAVEIGELGWNFIECEDTGKRKAKQ